MTPGLISNKLKTVFVFIQFICRKTYDIRLQAAYEGKEIPSIAIDDILRKLDADFFYFYRHWLKQGWFIKTGMANIR